MKSTCRVKARMLARRIWEKVYTIKKKSCESTNAFEMLKTQRVKGAGRLKLLGGVRAMEIREAPPARRRA